MIKQVYSLQLDDRMKQGVAGLDGMGVNMARRLRRGGLEVACFNRTASVTDGLVAETGAVAEMWQGFGGHAPGQDSAK
jgi:6-phosphogluconate dehydrogenase